MDDSLCDMEWIHYKQGFTLRDVTITPSQVKEIIKDVEEKIPEGHEDFKYYMIVVSALFVSPSIKNLVNFTGIDKQIILEVWIKMRKNGLWGDDWIHTEFDGTPLSFVIGICLMVLAAMGKVVTFFYMICEQCGKEKPNSYFGWIEETCYYNKICKQCLAPARMGSMVLKEMDELIKMYE